MKFTKPVKEMLFNHVNSHFPDITGLAKAALFTLFRNPDSAKRLLVSISRNSIADVWESIS